MSPRIYLDNHATTAVDPRVVQAMAPYWTERPGNASSAHLFGWEAAEAVEAAQEQVASLLGCSPKEVVFTSGATESNNMALFGLMEMYRDRGRHLVTTAIEHPAVLDAARHLETQGCELSVIGVDREGRVDPEELIGALREDTVLCSVMWANNEIGTIQPIEAIAAACREREIFFHTDAAQAVGKLPIDCRSAGIDLLSVAGHKFHAPKGVGALMVRRRQPRVRLAPYFHGGGQQKGYRPGTVAVPLVVGLGAACAIAQAELEGEAQRVSALRDGLIERLTSSLDGVLLNGHASQRLPGNANFSFLGVEAEAILLEMPGVALSTGSACSAAEHEPSHVLSAIGLSAEQAHASLRFGIGRFNTSEEIEYVGNAVIELVGRFRESRSKQR